MPFHASDPTEPNYWTMVLCQALEIPDAIVDKPAQLVARAERLTWPDLPAHAIEDKARHDAIRLAIPELPRLCSTGLLDRYLLGEEPIDEAAKALADAMPASDVGKNRVTAIYEAVLPKLLDWITCHPFGD